MKYIIMALLLALGTVAQSSPIVVRSGAHEDFTRLVFDLGSPIPWELDQESARVFVFRTPSHLDGFNTSQVFRRIDKSVLASLEEKDRNIRLILSCDCSIRAYSVGKNLVALDISRAANEDLESGQFTYNLPNVVASKKRGAAYSFGGFRASEVVVEPSINEEQIFDKPVDLPLRILEKNEIQNDLNRLGMPAELTQQPEVPVSIAALNLLEERLTQQIALAATQGILSPSEQPARNNSYYEEHPESSIVFDESNNPTFLENMSIHSVIEGDGEALSEIEQTLNGLSCPENAHFEIYNWSDGRGFAEQISEARSLIYEEFDQLNITNVLKLARIYLYFGLGAEALQVLEISEDTSSPFRAAKAIAHYLEYGVMKSEEYPSELLDCGGDVALWASLASDSDVLPEDEIIQSVSRLPFHLRSIIAPDVSSVFRRIGEVDLAEMALRTIERNPRVLESAAEIERAEIAITKGQFQSASGVLEGLSVQNDLEGPEALARMVDLHVANNMPVSTDTALLAAAYAAEHGESVLGPVVSRAQILSLAKTDRFLDAFSELSEATARYGEEMNATEADLLMLLSKMGNDAEFLRFSFVLPTGTLEILPDKVLILLAERMLEKKFFLKSREIASHISERVDAHDLAVLMARIELSNGNPSVALAALEELKGENIEAIRADIMLDLGLVDQAVDQYSNLGMGNSAVLAAWHSPTLGNNVEVLSPALELARNISSRRLPSSAEPTLQAADDLIGNSTSLLKDVRSLLSQPEIQPVR